MTIRDQIHQEVEDFLTRTGVTPTGFGLKCMNDKGFVFRLRNGANVKTDTIEVLRAFMKVYKPPKPRGRRGNDHAAA